MGSEADQYEHLISESTKAPPIVLPALAAQSTPAPDQTPLPLLTLTLTLTVPPVQAC